jgi:hypothetical protein
VLEQLTLGHLVMELMHFACDVGMNLCEPVAECCGLDECSPKSMC